MTNSSTIKQSIHFISQWWSLIAIAVIILVAQFSQYLMVNLPVGKKISDQDDNRKNSESFISERAWIDLKALTDLGPRIVGHNTNEILAVNLIINRIDKIIKQADTNQSIHLDLQRVSGSYYGNFKPNGMTSVYRNVQNIVVKLDGVINNNNNKTTASDEHSLLLNCHFDSVAGSPGASDDAASCCVMLEILRVLSKQPERTKHSIIFLFNGAEETGLQASHGFITQHLWAKNIRAFLNLESVGSNGKEMLFQSGPNHGWLSDMYRRGALYPHGQVGSEEIFQSGAIPSDTDFRIFRDFGNIPGMDFAQVLNGFRYHTKYDNIDYIPFSVLQRTGDNILSITKLIANSNELANTASLANERKVFYDFVGLIFIAYSENFGIFLNISIAILSVWLPFYFLNKSTNHIHTKRIKREMFYSFLTNIFAIIVAFGIVIGLIAREIDLSGNWLIWYHYRYLLVPLYCGPTLFVYCAIHRLAISMTTAGKLQQPLSQGLLIQARLNGTNIMWSLLLIFGTVIGKRSSYLFMLPLAFTLIANLIIYLFKLQNTIHKWLYIHGIGQLFVIFWTTYAYHLMVEMFVPIMARGGSDKNPERAFAIICLTMTTYITGYLNPLIGLLKKSRWFFGGLLITFLLARFGLLAFVSSDSFPYYDHSGVHPTPQRHAITHTFRTVYDKNFRINYTDSGFYITDMDRNTRKTLEKYVITSKNDLISREHNKLCNEIPFCGLPFHSCRQFHVGGFWEPTDSIPLLNEYPQLRYNSMKNISTNRRQLNLTITGTMLISLHINPINNYQLINWDINSTLPSEPTKFMDKNVYFIMMSHGIEAEPMNILLDFEKSNVEGNLVVDDLNDKSVVQLNMVGFHWEHHQWHTKEFREILAKFPEWTFVVPSVASLQSWTF